MDKQKFNKQNKLAEEALNELQQRLTEISITDANVDIEKDNILKIYQINGEPNWDEIFIVVTKNKETLLKVLSGNKDLYSLTKDEWNEILNPVPSNRLIFKYFKKLHNAYKTNILSNKNYDTAFAELNRKLKEKWETNSSKENIN